MTEKSSHPYHLLNPSPWPIFGAFSLLVLFIGIILAMHGVMKSPLWVGSVLIIITLAGWWKDVVTEAKSEHTQVVRRGFRYGMLLFIASELMFFVTFFWAYFNAALTPSEILGNTWPPKDITPLNPWDLPYFNTLVLLFSGTTITWAHDALTKGYVKEMMRMCALTILLGLLFLGVQTYEYIHATFPFKGGIYQSTFYMATGFHGCHVFVGIIFLGVAFVRAKLGHFKKGDHFGFDAAAWYWHFVDVVWLFLFMAIYWWGSGA